MVEHGKLMKRLDLFFKKEMTPEDLANSLRKAEFMLSHYIITDKNNCGAREDLAYVIYSLHTLQDELLLIDN